MSTLTPDMRAEIKQILRTSSPGLTHGEVFRYMERGLNAEQIASIRDTTNVYYVKDVPAVACTAQLREHAPAPTHGDQPRDQHGPVAHSARCEPGTPDDTGDQVP